MLVRVWRVSALSYEYGKGFGLECLHPYQCCSRVVSWHLKYTTRLQAAHIQYTELSPVNVTAGLSRILTVGPFLRSRTGAVDSTMCYDTGKIRDLSYQACHKCIDLYIGLFLVHVKAAVEARTGPTATTAHARRSVYWANGHESTP
jgi:hypothetical protein